MLQWCCKEHRLGNGVNKRKTYLRKYGHELLCCILCKREIKEWFARHILKAGWKCMQKRFPKKENKDTLI